MKTRTFVLSMISLTLLALGALFCAQHASAQTTGSLTLSTTVNDNGTLTPTLTWVSEAQSCVASGDSEWEGAKAGAGTQALSARPTSQPRAFALICTSPADTQAMLAWQRPLTNTDDSPLTNLAGYRISYGTSATALTQVVQLSTPGATSYTVTGLTPGPWFFAIRAYTTQGAESALSNVVSKTMKAGVEWSQQTGIKVPAAPVLE